jgi:hypothetical protein
MALPISTKTSIMNTWTGTTLLPRQAWRAAAAAGSHNSLCQQQEELLRRAAAVNVCVEGTRIGQMVMEFVGLLVHFGQVRHAVLVVEQRRPVHRLFAEFGGELWAELEAGVEEPDGEVDAAGWGVC